MYGGMLQPSPRTLWNKARHAEFMPRLPPRQLAKPGILGWAGNLALSCRCRLHVRGEAIKIPRMLHPPRACRFPRARSAVPPGSGGAAMQEGPLPSLGSARRGGQHTEGALHPFFCFSARSCWGKQWCFQEIHPQTVVVALWGVFNSGNRRAALCL